MSPAAVLAPVFAQLALTFGLLLWMGTLRVRALQRHDLHIRDIALGEPNWPVRIKQVENAFRNQLELPVLFYLLVVLALFTGWATAGFVVASWVFVASRFVHAAIHTTSNNVPRRFWVYTAGLFLLMGMWLWFAAAVAFGG